MYKRHQAEAVQGDRSRIAVDEGLEVLRASNEQSSTDVGQGHRHGAPLSGRTSLQ